MLSENRKQPSTNRGIIRGFFARLALIPVLLVLFSIPAQALYSTEFTGKAIGKYWKTGKIGQGQARPSAGFQPISYSQHLVLDSKRQGVDSVAEATLQFPLSSYYGVTLGFSVKSLGNRPDAPPQGIFGKTQRQFDGVSVSNDGVRWICIKSLADIGTNVERFYLPLDEAAALLGGYGKNFLIRFSWRGNGVAGTDGLAIDEVSLSGTWDNRISVIAPPVVVEGAPAVKVRLARRLVTKKPATFQLSQVPQGVLKMPASVTFPAKAASVEFLVSAVNDGNLDPHRKTVIQVSEGVFSPNLGSAAIRVGDITPLALSLELPESLTEGAAAKKGKLIFNRPPDSVIAVSLTANSSEISVPASVTVPLGSMEVEFPVEAFDDWSIDGPVAVEVTASSAAGVMKASTVAIDDDAAEIRMTVPPVLAEGKATTGQIRLGAGSTGPVTVHLTAAPHVAIQPAEVTLTGPPYSANFTLTAADDGVANPVRNAIVKASASGYAAAEKVVRLLDDEPSGFRITPLADLASPGQALRIRIEALDAEGMPLPAVNGNMQLHFGFQGGSTIPASPSVILLKDGAWDGEVTLPAGNQIPVALIGTHGTGISASAPLDSVRTLPLLAADLAYDPTRERFYATIPKGKPLHANSLIALDPATGEIAGSLSLPQNPDLLSITSGGEYLYVSLRDNGSVVQVDLATLTVVRTFSLGQDFGRFFYAGDMCTVEGKPDVLLVTRKADGSTGRGGVVAYERGTPLPRTITPYDDRAGVLLEPSADPAVFYGYDFETTWFGVNRIILESDGLRLDGSFRGLFSNSVADNNWNVESDIVTDGNTIFHTNGRRVDGTIPRRLEDLPLEGPVRPDLAAGRVYSLGLADDEASSRVFDQLVVCDPHQARELFRLALPLGHETPRSLTRWGRSGLAFTSNRGITLINGSRSLPATTQTDLKVAVSTSQAQAGSGETFHFTVDATNAGPLRAERTSVTVNVSGCTIDRISAGSAVIRNKDGKVELEIGALDSGASRRFEFHVTGSDPTFAACDASIRCELLEATAADNAAFAMTHVGFQPDRYSFNDLSLPVRALAWDASRGRIWIGIAKSAGPGLGGTVIGLDPATGEFTRPIPLHGDPNHFALSSHDSYLYVGLLDQPVVKRIALEEESVDLTIPMDVGLEAAMLYPGDMAVVPGAETTILVSRYDPGLRPSFKGVAVFDGAVKRPNATPGHTGANVIEPSADPSLFFGLNNDSTEFGFRHLRVDANGVTEESVHGGLFSYSFGIDIRSQGDRVFGTDGTVLDGKTPTPIGGFGRGGPMVPDEASQRAYFFRSSHWSVGYDIVDVHDLEHFGPIFSVSLPTGYSYPRDIIRWGANGIAFATQDSHLVVLSDPDVIPGDPQTDLAVDVAATPENGTVGQNVTYTVTAANQGSNPATETLVTLSFSDSESIVSCEGAEFFEEEGRVTFLARTMSAGASKTFTVVTRATEAGWAKCSAQITSQAVESEIADNSNFASVPISFDSGKDAINVLKIATAGLVEDRHRGVVWASLPYAGPGADRVIMSIDPATGRTVQRIQLKYAPGRLAISSNGKYLYAGLLDQPAIQRINLTSLTPDLLIPLGGLKAGDIEVLEGDGRSIFVSLRNGSTSDGYGGIAVFDDAVKRPKSLAHGFVNWIEPSSDPSVFFGVNTVTTWADFYRLKIDAEGVSQIDGTTGLVRNFGGEIHSEGDVVFGFFGEKIDGSVPASLEPLATQGHALPALDVNRVFYLESEYPGSYPEARRIRAFDGAVGVRAGELSLPNGLLNPGDFIRCSSDRLAFRTDDAVVFIRSTQLIPSASPSDLSVTLQGNAPATVGQSFTYSLKVTNHGTVAVSNTVAGVYFSDHQTIGTASGPGTVSVSGRRMSIGVGELAPGASATFSIPCTPVSAGVLTAKSAVTSSAVESNLTNNSATASLNAGFVSLPESANRLRIDAVDIIEDPVRGRVWASVAAAKITGIGAVVAIDPTTGLITDRLEIPGDPSVLAISRNGRYLYATLNGSAEIQRFDLQAKIPDLRVPLVPDVTSANYRAEEMVVLEGDGTSIMVARNNPPLTWNQQGVAVYDGTIMRPVVTGPSTGANRIEVSADPTVFFGFNSRSSEAGVRTLKVDASGVTETRNIPGLAGEFRDFRADGNLLLTARGGLIDGKELAVLGTFKNGSSLVDGLPWIDSASQTAYYATGGSINAYSTSTFLSKGSYATNGDIYPGSPVQLIRWGSDGFALLAESVGSGRLRGGDKILFVRWSAAPYPPRPVAAAAAFSVQADPLEMDSDGDGVTDGFEHLFGTPVDRAQELPLRMVAGAPADPVMKVRFPRRAGLSPKPYRYAVSSDLRNWQEASNVVERVLGTSEKDGVTIEIIEADIPKPPAGKGRGFVRLEWTEPEP